MSWRDLGETFSYGEAIALVAELRREFASHFTASLNGWDWAVTWGEINTATHTEWFMNVNKDPKLSREPIILPRPWSSKDKPEAVPDEERARLTKQLRDRSAFAS